ncbi:unnamed protein product [Heligmosomoides polygyrus]|uniref:Reverse transcriptase n=1 Tax=Heligmosomoides polygyrus TaxID=6339 RepID=A0A183FVR6_HELPZ|nr:unnamed protein product [Heligmosomoides polygyrus]
MLRWACGWTRRDRVRNEDVRAVMKTAPIQLKMREQRLRRYGHILRRPEDYPIRLALNFEAPRKHPRRAPRKRWKDVIKRDLAKVGATADDVLDRTRWQQITRSCDCAGLNAQEKKKLANGSTYKVYLDLHNGHL